MKVMKAKRRWELNFRGYEELNTIQIFGWINYEREGASTI